MNFPTCPFTIIPLAVLPKQEMPGEQETAVFTQQIAADVRMRIVDYAPGYIADHWCDIGHFAYVMSGEIIIELQGKSEHILKTGEAFLVSTYGDAPHRLSTTNGAQLLLVD